MNELHEWLEAHRIAYRPIDREVVEIEGFGKLFLADLSGVESIFCMRGAEVEFNLMERPEVLLAEGISSLFNHNSHSIRTLFSNSMHSRKTLRHSSRLMP